MSWYINSSAWNTCIRWRTSTLCQPWIAYSCFSECERSDSSTTCWQRELGIINKGTWGSWTCANCFWEREIQTIAACFCDCAYVEVNRTWLESCSSFSCNGKSNWVLPSTWSIKSCRHTSNWGILNSWTGWLSDGCYQRGHLICFNRTVIIISRKAIDFVYL